VLDYLDGNRRLLASFLSDLLPELRCILPEATYFAWLDCREIDASPASFFHDQAKVGLSDGATFGTGGAGYVRLNFATSRGLLEQILGAMAAAVSRRPGNGRLVTGNGVSRAGADGRHLASGNPSRES
jgi:cystathionine beta-lyase